MKNKGFYDELALDAEKTIRLIKWNLDMNQYDIIYGSITYNVYDLIAVYKMERMRFYNLIDEKEYYKLMELYYKYLDLKCKYDELESYVYYNSLSKGYTSVEDEDSIKKLSSKIEKIEKKLESYGLLEENVNFDGLIDSQVRLLSKKKNK